MLSDLIGADENQLINWDKHVVVILHMSILTLNSLNPLICFYSRRSIINCCLFYSKNLKNNYAVEVAKVILENQVNSLLLIKF